MVKILSGNQVKLLDELHLKHSGQFSHELMEEAARGFVKWFYEQDFDGNFLVFVFAGAGNNGGDGLAIARLLNEASRNIKIVKCFESEDQLNPDAKHNWNLLSPVIDMLEWKKFPGNSKGILIDAFLGVGFKGELRQTAKDIITTINHFDGIKISVDLPSGLHSETISKEYVVKADFTVSFAFPKLSLLLPEHSEYVGELSVVDIGISDDRYQSFDSNFFYVQQLDIPSLHRKFHRFSHKGDFGKILLVGGSPGKMGALTLSSKSALRTGSGLVTCHLEETERFILQVSVQEAMVTWGELGDLENYDAIGIGPGWGKVNRKHLLEQILNEFKKPLVIDADGLNLLAQNPELIARLPENSILTPHIGEFSRLAGSADNHLHRMELAKDFAQNYHVILVLKGANTVISLPDGRQLFNSTGTNYMATGGAGDVLTGMVTAYLGMGYLPENAAICGVFHHGLAGEFAGKKKRRSLIASDIIDEIPETYIQLNIV
ncbi:MAG: NAD(P)H-hydrate dehydratase [Algoriphagus sp.]|nr:NAD(P)H-hydrate dehydratase [Algoriphagus sp.]